ncbi:MAG: RsmD family RNA methyltransferase [[Clostridium] scindens]
MQKSKALPRKQGDLTPALNRLIPAVKGEWKMRVIAGSAKRIQLRTLDGMDTRPTTDRIKETLFNMLAPYP